MDNAKIARLEARIAELETHLQRHRDREQARLVRGLVDVDRAVRRYQSNLERDTWPTIAELLPPSVRR
jgi:hypothetical protein